MSNLSKAIKSLIKRHDKAIVLLVRYHVISQEEKMKAKFEFDSAANQVLIESIKCREISCKKISQNFKELEESYKNGQDQSKL